MSQSAVTSELSAWAIAILLARGACPMGAEIRDGDVLARVEWHPPDSNNEAVHRGVTLYVRAT